MMHMGRMSNRLGLVGGVVVHHEMEIEFWWWCSLQVAEEFEEPLSPCPDCVLTQICAA